MSSHFLPTPFPPFVQLPLLGLFLIPNPSLRLLSPLEPPGVAVVDATVPRARIRKNRVWVFFSHCPLASIS